MAFDVKVDPPGPQDFSASPANIESNVVHRIFIDEKNKLHFGYDITIEPLEPERDLDCPLAR